MIGTTFLSFFLALGAPQAKPDEQTGVVQHREDEVSLVVTSALGEGADGEVREFVTTRVKGLLTDRAIAVEDKAPRVLMLRIGWVEGRPTDYRVDMSFAAGQGVRMNRVESFDCACSGAELMQEIEVHLDSVLAADADLPEPVISPVVVSDPVPSRQPVDIMNTPMFNTGRVFVSLGAGGLAGGVVGFSTSLGFGDNPNVYYVVAGGGAAVLIAGVTMFAVNKKRHRQRIPRTSVSVSPRFLGLRGHF